jgi:hypothetical protein
VRSDDGIDFDDNGAASGGGFNCTSDFGSVDGNKDDGDIGFDCEYVSRGLGFSRGESEGIKWRGGCCDRAAIEGFRWCTSVGSGRDISVMRGYVIPGMWLRDP